MDIYRKVTDRIIEQLKNGIIPWEKPWIGEDTAFNRITKKKYSALNQFLVGEPGEYASFKQWESLGGKVKKGAKAKFVVFWKPVDRRLKEDDEEEGENRDGKEKKKSFPVLRYYNVFHISQIEGVESLNKEEYPNVVVPDEDADAVINDYLKREGVGFTEEKDGGSSYYNLMNDSVTVPEKKQFKNTNGYYSTVFHELTHSTGHPKRLNRMSLQTCAPFGSKEYSKEELVAEIGAATILNLLHLETDKTERNTVAYVQSWITTLENDERCIVTASTKAQKAVDLILNMDSETV